ncbi:MAG: DMT family transporter [Lysobacterales bacterium]
MQWSLLGLVALAGMALPFQAGMNASLAARVASGHVAATVNFTIGALVLALIVTTSRQWGALNAQSLSGSPWWIWGGGLIGAFAVYASLKAAPIIGAVALLGVIVSAQMTMSVVVDHFGWVGFPQQPITLSRIAGILFLLLGVWLIRR